MIKKVPKGLNCYIGVGGLLGDVDENKHFTLGEDL